MKGIMVAIVLAIMMVLHIAHAEEKLLVTDVLGKKEMEAAASFSYFNVTTDFSLPPPSLSRDGEVEEVRSAYSLNVGLGHGFEVGARFPYIFSRRTKIRSGTVPSVTIRDTEKGFGDISLGGKYRIFSERDKPFTLVTGLGIKLDTAPEGEGGTGTTDIKPFIAASTTVSESIRPFVSYTFIARNHGSKDTHTFLFGVEEEVNDNVGVRASLGVDFHTSSDAWSNYESYHLVLGSYVRIYRNLYAVPSVEYALISSADQKHDVGRADTSTSIGVILGFYCLF